MRKPTWTYALHAARYHYYMAWSEKFQALLSLVVGDFSAVYYNPSETQKAACAKKD
jgi:hypothetical protein